MGSALPFFTPYRNGLTGFQISDESCRASCFLGEVSTALCARSLCSAAECRCWTRPSPVPLIRATHGLPTPVCVFDTIPETGREPVSGCHVVWRLSYTGLDLELRSIRSLEKPSFRIIHLQPPILKNILSNSSNALGWSQMRRACASRNIFG